MCDARVQGGKLERVCGERRIPGMQFQSRSGGLQEGRYLSLPVIDGREQVGIGKGVGWVFEISKSP